MYLINLKSNILMASRIQLLRGKCPYCENFQIQRQLWLFDRIIYCLIRANKLKFMSNCMALVIYLFICLIAIIVEINI